MKIWIKKIQTKGETYTEVNLESVFGLETFDNNLNGFRKHVVLKVYAVFCRVINSKNGREV